MAPRGQVLPPRMSDAPPKIRGVNVVAMKSRGAVSQPEDRHRVRPADRPFLLEHDILRVENIDDVPWEFRWDRRRYMVRPGETGFVPFPAMVMAMGDPRAMENEMVRYNTEDGQRGVIFTRHEEFCRLFARYGIEQENLDDLIDFAPRLKCETMQGEPVHFPVQNPDMVAFPVPDAPQPGKEHSDTRRLMDRLQSDNEAMAQELAEMRSLIASKLGGTEDAQEQMDDRSVLSQALAGGATADTGPQTHL
jgi:hypothetical protein